MGIMVSKYYYGLCILGFSVIVYAKASMKGGYLSSAPPFFYL